MSPSRAATFAPRRPSAARTSSISRRVALVAVTAVAAMPVPAAAQATGRTVIATGHVDVYGQAAGGTVTAALKDGRDPQRPVVRSLDSVVLHVDEAARTVVPARPQYGFIGPAGSPVWLLSETGSDPALVWPGWDNTGDGTAGTAGMRWTLSGVRGPGAFTLYNSDAWGNPNVLFNSADGLPDHLDYDGHAHGTWTFSRPGVYCLDLTMTGLPLATPPVSGSGTLLVTVGAVDPATVGPADCGRGPDRETVPPPDAGPRPSVPVPDPGPAPGGTPLPEGSVAPAISGLRVGRALRLATLRDRGLRVTLRSPGAEARVRAELTVSRAGARRLGLRAPRTRLTLATRAPAARGTGSLAFRVRPGAAIRRRLKDARRASAPVLARLSITITARDGRSATVSRTIRLTRS